MGTLNFLELQDEVRSSLGGRIDLNPRLGRFLHLAQQRLARIHDFDEMEIYSEHLLRHTCNDSDRFLVMPTIREIYSIVLLDGAQSCKLVGRTPQYMDRMASKPEYWSRFRPREYTIWGNTVEVFPLPDHDYPIRMRWTQWPLDFQEDEDTSQFLNKDDVLIQLALSYANKSLGKDAEATSHEAEAMRLIAEAKEIDREKPDINLVPAKSDLEIAGAAYPPDPWNNPFVRDTNG